MISAGYDYMNLGYNIPLYRAARAVELLREGKPVPRGTIQVGFKHKTFEEICRYGLDKSVIEAMKKSSAVDETKQYMLVVEKILPKGAAHNVGIRGGDVLLKINGKQMHTYVDVESLLDSFVGKSIKIDMWRHGETRTFEVTVEDLEKMAPKEFLEISNAIIHDMSYPWALQYGMEMGGVFLAKQGYMFGGVPPSSIIKKIGIDETPNLSAFIKVMEALPNGTLVAVEYVNALDQNKVEISAATVDKRWYPFQRAVRDDTEGKWHFSDCEKPNDGETAQEKSVAIVGGISSSEVNTSTHVANALVSIEFSSPFPIEGGMNFGKSKAWGCGVIVDMELGLILCSRDVANTTLCDVQCTFAASKTIPAQVIFVHPLESYSIIKYDPHLLLNDATVQVRELELSKDRVVPGSKFEFVGLDRDQTLFYNETKVHQILDRQSMGSGMPSSFFGFMFSFGADHSHKPLPFESLRMGGESRGAVGVHYHKDEEIVMAYTLSPGRTHMAADVVPLLTAIQEAMHKGVPLPTELKSLPIYMEFMTLAIARSIRHLPDEWALKLMESNDSVQRKVLTVSRKMVGSNSYEKFEVNDIILSIDDTPVSLVGDYKKLVDGKETVKVSVLRSSKVIDLGQVRTTSFSALGTTRIVECCGLILHDPHPALLYLSSQDKFGKGGIYVAFKEGGSPAEQAEAKNGLHNSDETNEINSKLITRVNEAKVTSLDEFLDAVVKCKHDEYVKFTTKNVDNGELAVHNIRLDLEYWKTRDMSRMPSGEWVSKFIEHEK
mmetsp:Transcript_29626/g.36615  ORF Transcript_29626/g.36615 Transcript_29626/m.36615 type:complete len:776 (+) Transcript_29626:235-2562(+)